MHLFERHFKEVNISQRERSLFQAEGITRPIGRKNMRVWHFQETTECNKAGWDNESMSYTNNDKTGKASRGPD